MRCTRNIEQPHLGDVRVYFVRDNLCFRLDFQISPETTLSMYFVQDVTDFFSPKVHAKRTSTVPISALHFHIYTS
jgi:hypothetical protein